MSEQANTKESPDKGFSDLEWLPIADYHPEISTLAALIDEEGKVVLGVQAPGAPVGTFLDSNMRPLDFKPTFWAVPTNDEIKTLADK